MLEAKIVLGESLIVSLASEFIENNGEDAEIQGNMGEEERKQDCETKTFKRLSEKVKGKTIRTEFQWITSLQIREKNAEKIAGAGRKRWKIENEGVNRQKNWQEDIIHACSWDRDAMKNHYLMTQISDMVKHLYEWFFLKKNEIKKIPKNISSELLESFGWQPTEAEDIVWSDTHCAPVN